MKNFAILSSAAVLCSVSAFAAEEAAVAASAEETAKAAQAIEAVAAGEVATAKAVVGKAVAYLASRQNPDGSFADAKTPGLTGLVLWALCGSGDAKYDTAIRKASDFLLGCVQPDGGIYVPKDGRRGGDLSTYNTAVCLTALSFTRRTDLTRVMLDARSFLAGNQLDGDDSFAGGFGYDKPNPEHRYADLSNTHYVMQAMRLTQNVEDLRPEGEKKADLDWGAALDFVSGLQNGADAGDNAGGFAYSPADAKAGTEKAAPAEGEKKDGAEKVVLRSYGSITYAGLEALVYCNIDRTDPRVRSALDWASKHWTVDENPGQGDTGLFYFYDVMGRSLSVAGIDAIPRAAESAQAGKGDIDWRAELVAKIASLQKPDGSFVNRNGRFWENNPMLATAFSAISLEFATGMLK